MCDDALEKFERDTCIIFRCVAFDQSRTHFIWGLFSPRPIAAKLRPPPWVCHGSIRF